MADSPLQSPKAVSMPRKLQFGAPPGSGQSSLENSIDSYPSPDIPRLVDDAQPPTEPPRQGDPDPIDEPDASVREAASALVALFGQLAWSPTISPKKRHRRTNEELVKEFRCTLDGCTKAYASAGALKTHVGLKHIGSHSPSFNRAKQLPSPSGRESPSPR
eukprot:TRINITY_DN4812_c0_g1_i1.p1 TRINITY_DN4812_c0_g1~~TRINITY_DN4812_c0_g1_i1.p1  ORF type:complete len:161 (+),score=18.47 TRINITY_DN4812_c0_g1_i1:482-964(+)